MASSSSELMDQRKRKRMQSNRESARRSRLRKQKHLDDLTAQVGELRRINDQMVNSINFTSQQYLNMEAENSVLRAQIMELTRRLHSLDEILNLVKVSALPPGGDAHSTGWYGNPVILTQPADIFLC